MEEKFGEIQRQIDGIHMMLFFGGCTDAYLENLRSTAPDKYYAIKNALCHLRRWWVIRIDDIEFKNFIKKSNFRFFK